MLSNKKILLGVCGSIAAYKAAYLCRLLVKNGAEVKVILTKSAEKFVSPLSFSTLSKSKAYSDMFKNGVWNNHVELGSWADIFLVAPTSANSIGKMANGLCNNLLMATYLSSKCPVAIAPAMDLDMWKHPSTKRNITTLQKDGVKIIDVAYGELASGLVGEGRMAEPDDILTFISNEFFKK